MRDEKEMTSEEARKLKRFDHYCTCGGYAYKMNGRPASNPHMDYCPQKPQYDAWATATARREDKIGDD